MTIEEDKDQRTLGRDPLTESDKADWDSIWKIPESSDAGPPPPAASPPRPRPAEPRPEKTAVKTEPAKGPSAGAKPPQPPAKPRPAEPAPAKPAPPKAAETKTPDRPSRAATPPPKRTSTKRSAADRAALRSEGPVHLHLEPGQSLQAVGFQVAEEHFCVPLEKTQEIIRYQEPSAVPDSPPFVEGIINLRGRVIPVISVRKRFGVSEMDPTRQTRIVILHVTGAGVVGLVVDSVSEVIRVTADNLMDTSTFSSTHMDYIHGLSQIGDRLHIILDVDRLLSAAEKEVLASEELGED